MFFEGQRIVAMRQMILASDEADRRQALDKLLVMQREDITELFKIMDGNPVTIRLLDPPLPSCEHSEMQLPAWNAKVDRAAKQHAVQLQAVSTRSTWHSQRQAARTWETEVIFAAARVASFFADFAGH